MTELGYVICPDCSKGTGRVLKNKRGFAFYYCDRCMSQHQTRSGEGSDGLLARMTPVEGETSPPATGEDPDEEEGDDMAQSKKGDDDGKSKGNDRRQSNDRRTSSTGRTKPDQDQAKKEKTFGAEVFGETDTDD
jgi:hypothetical protein